MDRQEIRLEEARAARRREDEAFEDVLANLPAEMVIRDVSTGRAMTFRVPKQRRRRR